MKRSKSSKAWLREHFADPFVKRAHKEGLRSRSAYKLDELIDRDRLLVPGMRIVDLGAAPGGWSQVIQQRLGTRVTIIALDILPMPPLPFVTFIEGDFRDEAVLHVLERALDGKPVDLVLSDMAPNLSGVAMVDQARAMELAELALAFCDAQLRPDGAFLVKLFQGAGFDEYIRALRSRFGKVDMRKPKASRARSREVYALATQFRLASAANG